MNDDSELGKFVVPTDSFALKSNEDQLLWNGTPEEALQHLEQLCPSWELYKLSTASALRLLAQRYEMQRADAFAPPIEQEGETLSFSATERGSKVSRSSRISAPLLEAQTQAETLEAPLFTSRLTKNDLSQTFLSFCLEDALSLSSLSLSSHESHLTSDKTCCHSTSLPEYLSVMKRIRTFICCSRNRLPHQKENSTATEQDTKRLKESMPNRNLTSVLLLPPLPLYQPPVLHQDILSSSSFPWPSPYSTDSLPPCEQHFSAHAEDTLSHPTSAKGVIEVKQRFHQPIVKSLRWKDLHDPSWQAEQLEKIVTDEGKKKTANPSLASVDGDESSTNTAANFSLENCSFEHVCDDTTLSRAFRSVGTMPVDIFSQRLEKRLNEALSSEFSHCRASLGFLQQTSLAKMKQSEGRASGRKGKTFESTSYFPISDLSLCAQSGATAFVKNVSAFTDANRVARNTASHKCETDALLDAFEEQQTNDGDGTAARSRATVSSPSAVVNLEVAVFSRQSLEVPFSAPSFPFSTEKQESLVSHQDGLSSCCCLNCSSAPSAFVLDHSLVVGHVFFFQWCSSEFLITYENGWLLVSNSVSTDEKELKEETTVSCESEGIKECKLCADNYEHTVYATEHLRSRPSPLEYLTAEQPYYDSVVIPQLVAEILHKMTSVENTILTTSFPFHQRVGAVAQRIVPT